MTPAAGRAGIPAHTLSVARMMGLTTAAAMLGGQDELAKALGIQPRSLRAKLGGERGISGDELLSVAVALDDRAARIANHARKLRDEAGSLPPVADASSTPHDPEVTA